MAELAKAQLFSKDPECDVNMTVHFNPKEISIEKQVTWQPKEGAITDEPPEEFGKPTPASLSVTLHFDTYEQKESVKKKYTDPLSKLSRIMNQTTKKRPPLCMFSWGGDSVPRRGGFANRQIHDVPQHGYTGTRGVHSEDDGSQPGRYR